MREYQNNTTKRIHLEWQNFRRSLLRSGSPWRLSALNSIEARTVNRIQLIDALDESYAFKINFEGLRLAKEVVCCRSWHVLINDNRYRSLYCRIFNVSNVIWTKGFTLSQVNDSLPPTKQIEYRSPYLILATEN